MNATLLVARGFLALQLNLESGIGETTDKHYEPLMKAILMQRFLGYIRGAPSTQPKNCVLW